MKKNLSFNFNAKTSVFKLFFVFFSIFMAFSFVSCKQLPKATKTVVAEYPVSPEANLTSQQFMEGESYYNWRVEQEAKIDQAKKLQPAMQKSYAQILEKMLVSTSDKNEICSPLNLYIALSMLAECSDGNTRSEILNTLAIGDIKQLRNNIKTLWLSNYIDTPVIKSLLANSLWLRDNMEYSEATLNTLAENYYASAFSGEMGSATFNQALQNWMNEQTKGLLKDSIKGIKMTPQTVLALVSTLYYKATWLKSFNQRNTTKETFYGTKTEKDVDMMHTSYTMPYYKTDNFEAISLNVQDSGKMYIFLPNDAEKVNSIVSDPDTFKVLDDTLRTRGEARVNLSLPKFTVKSTTDLIDTLPKLGITEALTSGLANFSPITPQSNGLYVNKAEHTALLEIDEEGLTGAAYTVIMMSKSAMPMEMNKVDFIVNRPFYFVLTSGDGSILFAGVVKNL